MYNKRVSFEQKIEELLEKWATVWFSKIKWTDKYKVSVEFDEFQEYIDVEIWNDLWRSLTKQYNYIITEWNLPWYSPF